VYGANFLQAGAFALQVIERNPNDAQYHFVKGTSLAGLGRAEEAIAALDRALAQECGLTEWNAEETVIRKESGQPVNGFLVGLLKP
jgi:tetratricopeptide (TPR) repeat protein